MSSAQLFFHHAEIASTDFYRGGDGELTINAEVKNRKDGSVVMFFDCVDDVERLAEELRFMAESIREQEPKDFCAETGEVLV